MCGLLGYIRQDTARSQSVFSKFITQGLIIDTLRGDDGSGVFRASEDPKSNERWSWAKSVSDGYAFTNEDNFLKLSKRFNTDWTVNAHNRAATAGSVSSNNSHPFSDKNKNVILVHNGTLRGTWALPLNQQKCGVEVDSHALACNLGHVPPSAAGKEVLSNIQGAFTLLWYDNRDHTMNICRNSERPLHMGMSSTYGSLFYMSEAAQLQFLNERLKLGIDKIYQPAPGLFMKFSPGSLKPKVETVDLNSSRGSQWSVNSFRKGWRQADGQSNTSRRASSNNTAPPRTPNRVLVGGRMRDIPKILVKALNDAKLDPKDRLLMVPIRHREADGTYCQIVGHNATLDLTITLHDVPINLATRAFNQPWLVRPIGIKTLLDPDTKKPGRMVYAQLVNSDAKGLTEVVTYPRKKSSFTEARAVPGGALLGPCETPISEASFVGLTADGCGGCGDKVYVYQADEIRWLDDIPVCATCQDVYGEDINNYFGDGT